MLKDPRQLPSTILWFSNGGRYYQPWNSRHLGVLGVEDGCTNSVAGHRASIEPNHLTARGIPTAITLDPSGRVEVRHVIGTLPVPASLTEVTSVTIDGNFIIITGASGPAIRGAVRCRIFIWRRLTWRLFRWTGSPRALVPSQPFTS